MKLKTLTTWDNSKLISIYWPQLSRYFHHARPKSNIAGFFIEKKTTDNRLDFSFIKFETPIKSSKQIRTSQTNSIKTRHLWFYVIQKTVWHNTNKAWRRDVAFGLFWLRLRAKWKDSKTPCLKTPLVLGILLHEPCSQRVHRENYLHNRFSYQTSLFLFWSCKALQLFWQLGTTACLFHFYCPYLSKYFSTCITNIKYCAFYNSLLCSRKNLQSP